MMRPCSVDALKSEPMNKSLLPVLYAPCRRSYRLEFRIRLFALAFSIILFVSILWLLPQAQAGQQTGLYILGVLSLLTGLVSAIPNRVACDCKGKISCLEPWVCGSCKKTNSRTGIFSFLFWCQHCKAAQDSLFCPRCNSRIIFLTSRCESAVCAHLDGHPSREQKAQLDAERERKAANELEAIRLAEINRQRALASAERQWKIRKYLEETALLKAKMEYETTLQLAQQSSHRLQQRQSPLSREIDELRRFLEKFGINKLQAARIVKAEVAKSSALKDDVEMLERIYVLIQHKLEMDLP